MTAREKDLWSRWCIMGQKRGDLSRIAETLGISRQATWETVKRAKDKIKKGGGANDIATHYNLGRQGNTLS